MKLANDEIFQGSWKNGFYYGIGFLMAGRLPADRFALWVWFLPTVATGPTARRPPSCVQLSGVFLLVIIKQNDAVACSLQLAVAVAYSSS